MNDKTVYLYLVLELLNKNYFEGYRNALVKFIQLVQIADFLVVVARYKDKIENSSRKIHNYSNKYINKVEKLSESVA